MHQSVQTDPYSRQTGSCVDHTVGSGLFPSNFRAASKLAYLRSNTLLRSRLISGFLLVVVFGFCPSRLSLSTDSPPSGSQSLRSRFESSASLFSIGLGRAHQDKNPGEILFICERGTALFGGGGELHLICRSTQRLVARRRVLYGVGNGSNDLGIQTRNQLKSKIQSKALS